MVWSTRHSANAAAWELAALQHGVVARDQLTALGFSPRAIEHRIARGRIHPVMRGVYAVGRPELSCRGRWMAAVLSCGAGAVLSHGSAAALWGIVGESGQAVDVTVTGDPTGRCRPGVRVHRRQHLRPTDVTTRERVPVTTPVRTLLDLAIQLDRPRLERAVNEADRLDLVGPEELRVALGDYRGVRGVARLRVLLDRRTFRLTDSELERLFLPLAAVAGLPPPRTRQHVNGFRVDFFWPQLGLVVETDGLRYHRTPAQQARDRLRDQAHTAAGMTPLRFTHEQVRHEARYVRETLRAVAGRLVEDRVG